MNRAVAVALGALAMWLPAATAAQGAATAEQGASRATVPTDERTILATADTYIAEEDGDANFQGAAEVLVHHFDNGTTRAVKYALLRFDDLSSIPAGSEIQSARLEVHLLSGTGAGEAPVQTCAIEGPWSAGTVTWNNPPLMTSNIFCVGWTTIQPAPGVYSINLTAIVAAWRNGTRPNHGLLLTPDQGLNFLRTFESRDRGGASPFAPRLVVGYTPPPPLSGTLRSDPKGCTELGDGAIYQINDAFSLRYSVAGPPSARVRVTWLPATGAPQQLVDHTIAANTPTTRSGLRFAAADVGQGHFELDGMENATWQRLATCSVEVSEEPPPAPPSAGAPYDFGSLRIWADEFTVKRVFSGSANPNDKWLFVAHGSVRLGSKATNTPYVQVPVDIEVPVPGATATAFPIDSALTFTTLGGGPVPFDRQVFSASKACALTGTFRGAVPVLDSSVLRVSVDSATVSGQLCAGARPVGLRGSGRINLELPENTGADAVRLDVTFAVDEATPGNWRWSGNATSSWRLRLAGGETNAASASVALTNEGLVVSNLSYSLPLVYPATVTIGRLTVARNGTVAIHDASGSLEAPLPDWNLGGASGIRMRSAKARVQIDGAEFVLGVTACLEVSLPGNPAFTPVQADCQLSLTVRDGALEATLPAFTAPAAGREMRLGAATLERITDAPTPAYRIRISEATWDFGADWGVGTTIRLEDVAIQTRDPYLTVGGGSLETDLDQHFALGGGDPAMAVAEFHVQSLRLEVLSGRLTAMLTTELTLRVGVQTTTGLVLRLADGTLSTEVAVPELPAELAGLAFGLERVSYAAAMLRAESARLALPAGWLAEDGATSVAVDNVEVDRDGLRVGAIRIGFGNQRLGDTVELKDITAVVTPGGTGGLWTYALELETCVALHLPGDEPARFVGDCTVHVTITDGALDSVTLPDFEIPVAGLPMTFMQSQLSAWDGTLQQARPLLPDEPAAAGYRITASEVTWGLPAEWGDGTLDLEQVELLTAAPYLRVGGAGGRLTINRTFGLGGNPDIAVASFHVDTLELAYDGEVRARFTTHITLRVGKEVGADGVLVLEGGELSLEGTLDRLEPELGGLLLRLLDVGYSAGSFSAAQATLLLPADWLGGGAGVTGLTIDKDGVRFEGATFSVSDQDFGAVRLVGLQGAVVDVSGGSSPRRYRVDLSGTVKVVADLLVETGGTIHFQPDGRVDGEIDDFAISLVGFELEVSGATFDRNRVFAERAGLALPPEFSGLSGRVAAEVRGLVIDKDGIRVDGGGFELAIQAGDVGISGSANFAPDPNDRSHYIVAMQGEAGTPQMTIGVGVTIGWLDPGVELRRIYVSIEGTPPNAPTVLLEPTTQLFAYRLTGEMILTDTRRAVQVDGYARTVVSYFGFYLIEAHGGVTVEWAPDYYLLLTGDAKLLGKDVGEASIRITPDSVWVAGKLTASAGPAKIEAVIKAALGNDVDGELTMMAELAATLYIKEDAFFWGVPWSDIKLADAEATIGKHLRDGNKVWGVRASAGIKHIGRGYAWLGFSPKSSKIGKGNGKSRFTPIWPAGVALSTLRGSPHAAAAEAAALAGAALTAPAQPGQGAFTTGELVDFLVVEYLAPEAGFDSDTVTLTQPDGSILRPEVADRNEPRNTRYYLIENPMPGSWSVEAAAGSYVVVDGADPGPAVQSASVSGDGTPFLVSWTAASPGGPADVWLQAKSTDESGQYFVFADGLPLAGDTGWTPERLASGTYTIELVVDDGLQTVVHEVGQVTWTDATAPGPPTNLAVETGSEGSLSVTWLPPADADVAGYEITIGGGNPERRMGRDRTQYSTTGFNPGESTIIRVAAVDLSGNLGPAASTTATWTVVGPVVQWRIPRSGDLRVAPGRTEVELRFRDAAQVTEMSVRGPAGTPLAGIWAPVEFGHVAGTLLPLGARWIADVPLDASGRYEATITGLDSRGAAFETTWSWSVPPQTGTPLHLAYLPVARQAGGGWPGDRP